MVIVMAQPLPAGVVVKAVPAGGCGVDVQMTLVAASVASLDSVAVHLETCFKSGSIDTCGWMGGGMGGHIADIEL